MTAARVVMTGDLLMDVMTGPPIKRKGFATRVRNEIAAAKKRERKAKRKLNGKGGS